MRIQSTVRLTVPFLVFALAACNNPGSVDDTTATIPPAPMDQPAQDVPPATAPPPAPSAGLARFDGYGDMQFGMTEAQARAVIRPTVQALEASHRQRDYQACWAGLRRNFIAP